MSELRAELSDYLAIRRGLGFSLERAGRLLPDFVSFLERAEAPRITVDLAVAWACQPTGAQHGWWRERLGLVRGFARHLQVLDPLTEVPSPDLLPGNRSRQTPYLYSDSDMSALMGQARGLRPQWRAVTYETLIGLLAVTGLRLGETLGLDRSDVDLTAGVLLVRRAKFAKTREVPIHPSTGAALRRYSAVRDRKWASPVTPGYFVSARGQRLGEGTVHDNFRILVDRAGLQTRGGRCRPRPHDLRHSFAIRTLLQWYRDGVDVQARLPELSTFLGHVDPGCTYWYLQAAPELLGLASQRLETVMGELS